MLSESPSQQVNLSDAERRYIRSCKTYRVDPDGAVLIALRTRSATLKPTRPWTEADLLPLVDLLSTARPASALAPPEVAAVVAAAPAPAPATSAAEDEEAQTSAADVAPLVQLTARVRKITSRFATAATTAAAAEPLLEGLVSEDGSSTCEVSPAWITRLDFTGATFGSNGAGLLAQLLATNATVRELCLAKCNVGPRGFEALARALVTNSTLERLEMHGNSCHRARAEVLAKALLQGAHRLQHLDLSNCSLSWEGCTAINSAIDKLAERRKQAPRIEFLEFGNWVREEIWNSVTHGIGALFAFIGSIVMLVAHRHRSWDRLVCAGVFLFGMSFVYFASLFYHSFFQLPKAKRVFHRLDKTAIYLLIAGTYTPFAVLTLRGRIGWILLGIEWAGACFGIALDIFAFYKWLRLKLVLYVSLGWAAVLVIIPAMTHPHIPLSGAGIAWLAAGGITYTIGVYFFVKDEEKPILHVVWHVFVLAATAMHYICIFFFVLPAPYPVPPVDKYFYTSEPALASNSSSSGSVAFTN